MDRGACWATVHGVTRIKHDLVTKAPLRPTRESQELSGEENRRRPFSHSLKCPRQQLQIADRYLTIDSKPLEKPLGLANPMHMHT